ncbi:related to cell division control protein 15 [Ceraceosorus bombacis]|uniref:Related to cell division control protein 15 n=1 Tax=Ceraceosorus bombacis TaxID=401625 RepID=A0A0P1BS38_9BASI|nr:related to cell division control protein 15 [Ceraceosorus bombacis]
MGYDGGEAGRRMAEEDELIRRELADTDAFCNAFWGTSSAGYDTVQARMKHASKTMDAVRALYKERADIEADYAKRLGKLSKAHADLGLHETGQTKIALETVRFEVERMSSTHADLGNMIKKDLDGAMADFVGNWAGARRNLWKQKQTQESYVNKSREKYEQDCIKINGYTAQSSLVQGRDLDKVTAKLDKAQATVSGNEKDYQNFVRALKDTTHKWNAEWKSYLDQCQDLEEERLDFIKANLWNYANAVSAVCVADDESCENVRVSLENCEASRDIQAFIQAQGTGSAIPDPPEYINYARAAENAPHVQSVAPERTAIPERRMSARNFIARTPSLSKRTSNAPGGAVNQGSATPQGAPSRPPPGKADPEEDPLAKALQNLRNRPGGRSPAPPSPGPAPPTKSPAPGEVFPAHQQPPLRSAQRAPSPGPGGPPRARSPSAAFMNAPERAPSPAVVEEYGQSFPGERRALSRQNSNVSQHVPAKPQQHAQQQQRPQAGGYPGGIERARSPGPGGGQGFAGVGARGRSPSPAPQAQGGVASRPSGQQAQGFKAPQHPPVRSTTPLGISLDASGSVTHDQMADEYNKRAGSSQPSMASHYSGAQQQGPGGTPGVYAPQAGHHQQQMSYASTAPALAAQPHGQPGYHAQQPSAHTPQPQDHDSGKPILFYVSALYNYEATSEEEFSFTAGDIIAIWETSPDGWWRGDLLDENRRTGATLCPSNFLQLLA